MGISNFKMSGLGEIIRSCMYIPKYQRSYAWGKDEYIDLWDDLVFLIDEGNEMHFYGQIVIHKNKEDENKLYIIDGQQRITTSYFLISAFLNGYNTIYNKYKDPTVKDAKKLNRKIIEIEQLIGYNSNENYENQNINLIQNDIDNEYFIKLICREESALKEKNPSKSSKNLMRSALNFFDSKIKNLVKNLDTLEEKLALLDTYYSAFTNKFKIMYLEDDNLSEAYTIFETLNDRGKDLVSTDLLKNYILANSTNVETAHKKWNKIVVNLDSLDITKFIRHVWNAEHDFTRDKILYSNITNELQRSAVRCEKLLDDLNQSSLFYHDLFDPENPKIVDEQDFLTTMKALKVMKSVTWCPVLISMYIKKDANDSKKYDISEISSVAKCIETLVFKNFVICSNNPNEVEVKFANLAKNISLKNYTSSEVIDTVRSWIVPDNVFEASFKEHSFSDSENDKEKIRYIFRKIHRLLDKTNEININNTEVHIEHILPQNKDQWPHISDDIQEQYLWKLGNLCLLSGPLNIEISNRPFAYKKENAYKISVIKPNNDLMSYNDWNEESINDRQNKILSYVKLIWK